MKMFERYELELTPDYLNNKCVYTDRYGMYPTVDMIMEYNSIHYRPSIIPSTTASQLRALFAEILPYTANINFAENRFKKLCGYMNVCYPLSPRYKNLQEIAGKLSTLILLHDMSNYDKFNRMLQIIAVQNNIPIIFDKYSKWDNEHTEVPNETLTIEGESSTSNSISDTTRTTGTVTDSGTDTTTQTKTGTERTDKTGTEALAKTGTEGKTGTEALARTGTVSEENDNVRDIGGSDETITNQNQTIEQEKNNGITAFDDTSNFANDTKMNNESTLEKDTTETTNYGQSITDDGSKVTTFANTDTTTYNTTMTHNTTDTTTYNTEDLTTFNTTLLTSGSKSNTETTNLSTAKTATNTGTGETSETRTKTGRNIEGGSGNKFANSGLSMQELIERESLLLPVFDAYLLSIAREITLSCVEEIW